MASITEQTIDFAIKQAVENHVRKITEEEICRAQENIARRTREGLAQVVMAVHAMYEVEFDRRRILISVKTDA